MKLTVPVSAKEFETMQAAAKKEGFASADAWLTYHAAKIIARHAKGDLDLSPKDARAQLNVSEWAFSKLMGAGAFPNLYYVNSRVVRIPQGDIDAYKNKRTPFSKVA
jgi:hypothetical protein